jgi:hypothetical protein
MSAVPVAHRMTAEELLDARPPSPLPQLAAEVRSPSTWRYDIGAMNAGYERDGLEVDDTLPSPQLEDVALALAELFPE